MGYIIQFWVLEDGENSMQHVEFPYDSTSGTISLLRPFSNIVLQIRVRNTLYESEASEQVQLTTPEGEVVSKGHGNDLCDQNEMLSSRWISDS